MISIWEFRVLGILIWGGVDTHERERERERDMHERERERFKKMFLTNWKEEFLVF